MKSLHQLAANVDAGGSDEASLFACLRYALTICGSDRQPLPTRQAILEGLLLPLLRRASPNSLLRVFTTNHLMPFGRKPPDAEHSLLDHALALLKKSAPAAGAQSAEFYFDKTLAMNLIEQVIISLSLPHLFLFHCLCVYRVHLLRQ